MSLRSRWDHLKAAVIGPPQGGSSTPSRKALGPFEGAGYGRRAADWQTSSYGPASLVPNSAHTLRARARQLGRNNVWVSNALDTYASEVIGTGIKPQSQHPEEAVRKAIHEAWKRWTDEADADGQLDFYGLQTLIARSEVEAGEVFARFRPRRASDGLSVPLQIQVIEGDLCPVEKTEIRDGAKIRAGIEFDKIDNRAAYWMYRAHPGDGMLALGADLDLHRVKASEVMHVYRVLRPGQLRGQPRMTSSIVKLHELGAYDDAEVARKKVAAMYAGFIELNSPTDTPLPQIEEFEDLMGKVTQAITPLEPGLMQVVYPGWKFSESKPNDVGPNYEVFMKLQLKACAAGIGLSYDQYAGDLTEVNYNSLRASLLTIRRKMEQTQHQIYAFQFCRRVYLRWLETAVMVGAIKGVTASAYNADPYAFQRVEWQPDGWGWVDPVKDVQSKKMEIRAGLTSRQKAVHERGYDPEEIDRENAEDNKRADGLGLVYDSDPRQTDASGGSGKSERTDSNNAAAGEKQPLNGRDRSEDSARVN